MNTVDPLLSAPTSFKVESATERLKQYTSSGNDQMLAEFIQARGNTIHPEIHKPINSTWNKEELPQQWKESFYVPIYKKRDKTNCNI